MISKCVIGFGILRSLSASNRLLTDGVFRLWSPLPEGEGTGKGTRLIKRVLRAPTVLRPLLRLRAPGVRARIPSFGRLHESRQVMLPALVLLQRRLAAQAHVPQPHDRLLAVR